MKSAAGAIRILILIISAVLSMLCVFPGNALAEVNVYLVSCVETEGSLTLGDIARIDSDRETAAKLRALPVKQELYQDGYVDRKELEQLLGSSTTETVFIYGSAVRITQIEKKNPGEETADMAAADAVQIRKGDSVGITFRNRGILVHLSGSAMQDGKIGDEITVRIKGNRTLKGKITDKKMIELAM